MRQYASLRGRREFALALGRGAACSAPALTVHAYTPPARAAGKPKVGIIVTRKVGKAVVRNKIRRRCKAILQSVVAPSDARWFVVACKPAAATLAFAELRGQLTGAAAGAVARRGRG